MPDEHRNEDGKVVLARFDQDEHTPLTWGWSGEGKGVRVLLARCANGHVSSFMDHDVDGDGVVSPSMVCGYPDCGWHEFGILEGWDGDRRSKDFDDK